MSGARSKSTSSSDAPTREKLERRPRTTWMVVSCMLTWLEIPANFDRMNGEAAKGSVEAGAKLSKAAAYQ